MLNIVAAAMDERKKFKLTQTSRLPTKHTRADKLNSLQFILKSCHFKHGINVRQFMESSKICQSVLDTMFLVL